MLHRQNYQRSFLILASALVVKSTITKRSFVFSSAFSPVSRVSSTYSSADTLPSTSRTMVPETNSVSLSFLEAPENACEGGRQKSSSPSLSPPTLFVHGLDSSSQTWNSLLSDLGDKGYSAVAVDQRGCGSSPLDDPDKFSPDALVEDLHALLSSHPHFRNNAPGDVERNDPIKPFVLVGHSMGGRVAMSFAAKYPELIATLVIEDMDVRKRFLKDSRIQSKDRDATLTFDRSLPGLTTPEEVVEAFERFGYPLSQVEKWLSEGRVKGTSAGNYYSEVNPAFRLLCYEQFFESNHGEDTWKKLAAMKRGFPIHLMIADPDMTVCDEASVAVMVDIMEKPASLPSSTPSPVLKIHRYPGATHSIHNSVPEAFRKDLEAIIEQARK